MDINVKVTVELGEQTKAFISSIMTGSVAASETPAKTAPPKAAPAAAKPAAEVATPKATVKAKTPGFEDLDDDAKLEAIKTLQTKHIKKGKSADIKALLTAFGAAKASELETSQYDAYYAAAKRYDAGESAEDIAASIGGDVEDMD